MADYILDDAGVLLALLRESYAREKCCFICLKVVSPHDRKKHKQSAEHKFLVGCLKREIYPFSCIKCPMRLSTKRDLLHHTFGHTEEEVIRDPENEIFSQVCCYLCRLPFETKGELDEHCSTSIDHQCRRDMVLEFALRDFVASAELRASFEESLHCSNSAPSPVQDQEINLLDTSLDRNCNYSNANDIYDSEESNSGALMQSIATPSELLPKKEVLDPEDTAKVTDSTSASVQDKLEEAVKGLALVKENCSDLLQCDATLLDAMEAHYAPLAETRINFPSKLEGNAKMLDDLDSLNAVLKSVIDKEKTGNDQLAGPCAAVSTLQGEPDTFSQCCSSDASNTSQYYCSVCSVPVPKSNMTEHMRGKLHSKKALLTNKSNICTVDAFLNDKKVPLKSENTSEKFTKTEESAKFTQTEESAKFTQTEESAKFAKTEKSAIFTKTEESAIEQAVTIGDSTFTCLQEEFDEVEFSLGKDLNDYQVECETCGGVIETFNDNLDLSFDLHVQNDPQHALALAVPLERDAKQIAELCKTSSVPASNRKTSNAHQTVKQTVPHKIVVDSHAVVKSPTPEAENSISLLFNCRICNKSMTAGNKMSHLLGKQHKLNASLDFFCDICSENMTQGEKEDHLNSTRHKENASRPFHCRICSKIMNQGNKSSHLLGRSHKDKAASTFSCTVCLENMTRGEMEEHLISAKHKEHASLPYECKICSRSMMLAHKSAHLLGKQHKQNASLLYFCEPCSKNMTRGDMEEHLTSAKHKETAALPFFCKVCLIYTCRATKSKHLNDKKHKFNATLGFSCEACSENMTQGEKEEHLASAKHIENASQLFFCLFCDKSMSLVDKDSHLSGKQHKASLNHAPYVCSICCKTMTRGNMSSHLRGSQHKSNASKQ